MTEFTRTQRPLEDPDAARLAADVQHVDLRDAALRIIDRPTAAIHMALWGDLARRAPDSVKTAVAELLAFSCWLAGDGARAWVALDQIPNREHRNLAVLVSHALVNGLSPALWTSQPAPPQLATLTHNQVPDRSTKRNRQLPPTDPGRPPRTAGPAR